MFSYDQYGYFNVSIYLFIYSNFIADKIADKTTTSKNANQCRFLVIKWI